LPTPGAPVSPITRARYGSRPSGPGAARPAITRRSVAEAAESAAASPAARSISEISRATARGRPARVPAISSSTWSAPRALPSGPPAHGPRRYRRSGRGDLEDQGVALAAAAAQARGAHPAAAAAQLVGEGEHDARARGA